jgi:hypothetical protein
MAASDASKSEVTQIQMFLLTYKLCNGWKYELQVYDSTEIYAEAEVT